MLESILTRTFESNPYSAIIHFQLDDAIINHSFSEKSLVLFYLSMSSIDSAKYKQVAINLSTPKELVLNSSIPNAERIVYLNGMLNYDMQINAADSGLLFNFKDTTHAIFEEITLFIISSVFGFLSVFLIEQLIKSKV